MIASVVVTLIDDAGRLTSTLDEIALRTELEVGKFQITDRRIPMTIDATSRSTMEEATDWLRGRSGVVLVDVVFVHFEATDEDDAIASRAEEMTQERAQ